jgi:excisionase family DNA binding protein
VTKYNKHYTNNLYVIKGGFNMTHAEKIERLEILKHRPVLSKAEYNELTGISIPTITRLVLDGKIPARKIGRSVRIINDFSGNN